MAFQSLAMPRPQTTSKPATPVVPIERVRPPLKREAPLKVQMPAVRTDDAVAELISRYRVAFEYTPGQDVTITRLLDIVVQVTGVRANEIRSQRRAARHVKARQILFWLCRRYTCRSFPEMGRFIGGRDHATVFYGTKRVQALVNKIAKPDADNPEMWARLLWEIEWPHAGKRDENGRYVRIAE